MPESEDSGILSTHWALGTLVLVGLASSEFAGAATIIALPITAITITLAVLCEPASRPSALVPRRRKSSDVIEFLEIWLNILEFLAGAATCARVASATMDYMSRGRLRDWLFGLQSHSLGEPWPDVLGVTIVVVTTALFMLGLDKSLSLSILLYAVLAISFLFFLVVGSLHTDIRFWSWAEDFNVDNWKFILTTAAMCTFAFPNVVALSQKKCLKYFCYLVAPLLCYVLVVLVFTLMSHFRELAGTAIPLVRVFEVRDVDWARPIMAVCTIFVGCLALTEIIPVLCNLVVVLAGREWRVFVSSLLYRSSTTGAPILAIFTVGSLSSILAFACPLSYLVRLLNVSPLLKCALRSSRALYGRYKPEFPHEGLSVQHSSIQYSRLHKAQKKILKPSPTTRIKTAFDIMPRFFRNSAVPSSLRTNKVEDQEYLLMDDYNQQCSNQPMIVESDSDDSEINEMSSVCTEGECESGSSTDIDAIVQEYKEQIRVTTVNTFSDQKAPTRLTSQVVIVCIMFLHGSFNMAAGGLFCERPILVWIGLSGTVLCAVVILSMPQNKQPLHSEDVVPRKLFPFVSIASIAFSCTLAATMLPEVWFGIGMWLCGGLILFCRCDCCNCEGLYPTSKERVRLQGPKRECPSTTFADQHSDHIDAVLITR